MSGKPKKVDPNYVSQRVLQTKKEIEQLKLELEKLINRGIDADKVNCSTIILSDDRNEIKTKSNESKNVLNIPLHSSAQQNPSVIKKPSSTFIPKKNYKKEETSTEVSPKKIRHYNVEEAREYMKKQKEKRMEKMKMQMQASQNVIDIRKEKLKELQKRSLELVQKNVTLKRERSRSRERKTLQEKEIPQNDIKMNVELTNKKQGSYMKNTCNPTNNCKDNCNRVPDLIVTSTEEVPAVCSIKDQNVQTDFDLKNICLRNNTEGELITFDDLVKRDSDIQHKAALKIQSCYRSYHQRKILKNILKNKKKNSNTLKIIKPAPHTENLKPASEKLAQNNVPFWLQTCVEPYPYNFISAVKKKLNLATNTPIKSSSDIGVQISIEEPEKVEILKTTNEIKKAITESLNYAGSFTSHKSLGLNLTNVKELHLCDEKLRTSQNDCDIHTHSDGNIPSKLTHSKLKRIEQGSDTSESDTSKNIPDISSEANVSTIHSKNHIETDSSEYKLNINVDKLKNLKLQERTLNNTENTKLILSNNTHKEEQILLNEVPQINEYKDVSKKSRISGNIQEILGSSGSLKFTHTLHPSVTGNKHSKSVENIRSESIKDIFYHKSDAKSNNSSSVVSQQMSKSETHISTASNLNKLSKRSSNSILVKNSRSETNVPKLLNQEKPYNDCQHDIESDDNLKSFLEYMTSLEDSKKSRSLQKRSSSHRTSNSFKTLPDKSEKNSETAADTIKTDKENSSGENYSTNFTNSAASTTSSVPLLQCPSVTLTTSERVDLPLKEQNRNSISIKPGEIKCIETKTNTNQIHLKFEAELHLLNDFNESLRQFMAIEKQSLIELHGTNQSNIKVHQNQDTQTTAPLPPSTIKKLDDTIDTVTVNSQVSERSVPTINYERGSDIMEENNKTLDVLANFQDNINQNLDIEENLQQANCHYSNKDDNSILMDLELSQLNKAVNSTIDVSMSNTSVRDVSFNNNVYVGFSVGMFDQLIRDEDARIENLKTILKIREKALLDRTKGELAWLEIQKKQLIETGQLHEASLLKKKQRGIIIKLQHEKQEMQRLKQIQKAASKERKTILKEQRNMIKAQLSNSNAVPKIRRSVYKERRHLGPVKVYNLHRETINTETSISRRSSLAEEIIITSRSESIVGQISEEGPGDHDASMILNTSFKGVLNKKNEEVKKSLLMREAALQKRKKAAEELLQWHQRLLEEERKIAELEMAANTIIKQVPVHVGDSLCKSEDEKYDFKGSQLNFLWTNMTGRDEKKFKDDERYSLNQMTLEKFCTDAKRNLIEKRSHLDKIEKNSNSSNSSLKTVNDLIKDKSDSGGHTVLESTIVEDIKSDNDSTETERRKCISNDDKFYQSQDNTYSYSFESDAPELIDENVFVEDKNETNTVKSNADVLVNEIDRSKSTLSEIMQNISNITDEISAIYKLSSVANTIKDESVHSNVNTDNVDIRSKVTDSYIIRKDSDNIPQGDESEDDTLKSSVQSEIIKSLTELISSQNACQDIKFEQKHNIIETPESAHSKNTLTDSQGTLTSNIELCINSNKPEGKTNKTLTNDIESAVSLHTNLNKELPREDAVVKDSFISVPEQEDITDSSKTKTEVISVSKGSGDVINGVRRESNNQSVMTKVCSVNDTSDIIKNNTVTSTEESQNNEIGETSTSKSEIRNMLDLSYGFTGVRTNKHETISSISEINKTMKDETNITNELPIENGFKNVDLKVSDDTIDSIENSGLPVADVLNKSLVIKENEEKCELETNIKNNSTSDKLKNKLALNSIHNDSLNIDFNKSNEETTISTESGFEKSVNTEEYNDINGNEELESSLENINNTKLSSLVKINDSIIDSNTKNSSNVSISNEIREEKSCMDNLLVDDVNNSSKDIKRNSVSENIDDNSKLTTSSQNDNAKSESTNESDIQDEEDISDLSNKSLDNTSEELSSDNNREKLVLNLEKLYDIEDGKSATAKKENDDNQVDVKKRVCEILADTTPAREDKSPRLQDIYTTTYDVLSPEHSPEIGSPANSGRNIASVTQLYDEEAEALFKKQLAIEQEIKQLEQQQKEHIPYIYMREIPNKPPPPYTPPISQIHVSTVLPSSVEQLQCMTSIISDKLFKAYVNGNLETSAPDITEASNFLTRHNIDKECFEFIFDLCKEFAVEHYKQFVEYSGPSWMVVNKKSLTKRKPFEGVELRAYLFKKTKEILEFEKVIFKEKMITKWSRKKRDHVDEILVIESQTEESEWTNYDDDEVIVKNELTNDIMNMLLTETANVISKIFNKKMNLS